MIHLIGAGITASRYGKRLSRQESITENQKGDTLRIPEYIMNEVMKMHLAPIDIGGNCVDCVECQDECRQDRGTLCACGTCQITQEKHDPRYFAVLVQAQGELTPVNNNPHRPGTEPRHAIGHLSRK